MCVGYAGFMESRETDTDESTDAIVCIGGIVSRRGVRRRGDQGGTERSNAVCFGSC